MAIYRMRRCTRSGFILLFWATRRRAVESCAGGPLSARLCGVLALGLWKSGRVSLSGRPDAISGAWC